MKTIPQLAKELQVTPQTIRNEIERQSISKSKAKGSNCFCVCDEDADRIKSAILERREKQSKSKAMAKTKQNDTLLLRLQEEIEEKNRLLKLKDEQIDRLTATVQEQASNVTSLTIALENTTASLKASQLLHAGTLQERLEDTRQEEPTPPEKVKRWWEFWK